MFRCYGPDHDFRYYSLNYDFNYDHVHVYDITILKLVDFLSSYSLLNSNSMGLTGTGPVYNCNTQSFIMEFVVYGLNRI